MDPRAVTRPDAAARLPQFFGAPADASEAIRRTRIALVGAGSVGLAGSLHLTRVGFRRFLIIDRGTLKPESLLTHPLPAPAVGLGKAAFARDAILDIAPDAEVEIHAAAFQDLPVDTLAADVVVLAVDNLETELLVAERALNLGIPLLLQPTVGGRLLVAQVRALVAGADEDRTCLACTYSKQEWSQLSAESRYSCDGTGTRRGVSETDDRARSLMPTASPSYLCSQAAELAVNQAVRHVLGIGVPLRDQIVEFHGYTDTMITSPLVRRRDCTVDHRRWNVIPVRRALGNVHAALRMSGVAQPCTVEVDGTRFVPAAASDGATSDRFSPHLHLPVRTCPSLVIEETTRVDAIAIPSGRAVLVRDRDGRATMLTPNPAFRDAPNP